jgi:Lsr2
MSEDSTARRTHRPTAHDRGLAEGARFWAREQGLPVPARGQVPPTIIRQYRQRTAPN